MLPVTPDDERTEPASPAGGHRPERGQRVRDAHDGDVAEGRRVGDRPRHDDGRRAAVDRVVHEGVAVDVLAGQGHEQLAGLDEARIDGGAADGVVGPGEEPAAGQADQVVGREGRRRDRSLGLGRRIDVGHGRQCRTAALTGPCRRSESGQRRDGSSRSGVVIASVATRRNSSNDMTGISRRPTLMTVGVPSSIWTATTRSG